MGKDIKNADGFMVEYDILKKGIVLTFKGSKVWGKLSYAKSFLTREKQYFKGNFVEGRIIPLYAKPENTFIYIDGPSRPQPYKTDCLREDEGYE